MKTLLFNILLSAAILSTINADAQHDMHTMPMTGTAPKMQDSSMHQMPPMTSQFSLALPMNVNGSGTAWSPQSSPMYGYMFHSNKWNGMVHGSVYLRYNQQDISNEGNRGGKKFDAPNWFMLMLSHPEGKNGLFSFSSMLSLDPLTVGKAGYPLLFQTGESYKGQRLVDKQHPHDLFSELSIAYTQQLNKDIDLNAYLGYPGEPALGPTAFMHRVSAMNNPDAVLGHHYQDATHITFGVATLGIRYKMLKFESSLFTGREPDEFRYGFDKPLFDSYSFRLSALPGRDWSAQVSYGYLKNPELLEPGVNVKRTTASVMNTTSLASSTYLATTAVWGMNNKHAENFNSFLLESSLLLNKTGIYARYEWLQKDAEELDLISDYRQNPHWNISSLAIGINQRLYSFLKTDFTLGVQATFNFPPADLKPLYGETPVGGEIYLRINPSRMIMGKMKHTHTGPMNM